MSSTEQAAPHKDPFVERNGIEATYDLHCHCGAIKYKMTISPPLYVEDTQGKEQLRVMECDCSYCERTGSWSVHPLAKDVEFTQGLEYRTSYYSGPKKNPHWFCSKCGSVLGVDLSWLMANVFHGEARYSINVRMLKDFDPKKLNVQPAPGMKNVGPKYEV